MGAERKRDGWRRASASRAREDPGSRRIAFWSGIQRRLAISWSGPSGTFCQPTRAAKTKATVHAREGEQSRLDAGLFAHLAERGDPRSFLGLDASARKRPLLLTAGLDDEDLIPAEDNGESGVPACHDSPLQCIEVSSDFAVDWRGKRKILASGDIR